MKRPPLSLFLTLNTPPPPTPPRSCLSHPYQVTSSGHPLSFPSPKTPHPPPPLTFQLNEPHRKKKIPTHFTLSPHNCEEEEEEGGKQSQRATFGRRKKRHFAVFNRLGGSEVSALATRVKRGRRIRRNADWSHHCGAQSPISVHAERGHGT